MQKRKETKLTLSSIIKRHLLKAKGSIAIALLCMIGFTIAEMATPWPLKFIFDYILLDKQPPAYLDFIANLKQQGKGTAVVIISLSIILLAALRGIFSYLQVYITSRIGSELVYTLRRRLFIHLQQLSLSYYSRARTGDMLTRVVNDTAAMKDVFAESALNFISLILTVIGMFIVMMVMNWKLGLIVFATFPLLCWSLLVVYRRIRTSSRKQREREGVIASRLHEVLSLQQMVRAFAREKHEQELFEQESSITLEETIHADRLEAAATRSSEIITSAGTCAVVLYGSLLVLNGKILPGDVLVFAAYLNAMYKPLRSLARISSRFSKAMAGAERVSSIFEIEPEISNQNNGSKSLDLKGSISFRNVVFGYNDDSLVLKNVSFDVQPGQRVALVGASGAGKSTIASLILKFYKPRGGQILIDGIDINNFDSESLRERIGVVLQESILFGASVHDNISYGKPNAPIQEIIAAAKEAYAHDFIKKLPDGYDTVIGERGATLSGGERQRLCIARAVIKKPLMLILDEPVSAMDAESTLLIQRAVNKLQQGKTMILIAHQFSGLETFDQILVLKNGEIIERGTHQELLSKREYYFELYSFQSLTDKI